MLKIFVLLSCLLLTACLVGPDYKEPAKKIADHWIQNSPAVKVAPIKDSNWWNVFRDPTLTSLIQRGYQNNLSLQSTGVRVLQARAKLAQSVGELYPQQQAMGGDYTYYRLGGSQLNRFLPQHFQSLSLGLNASWELDFWGKYRRAVRANDAMFFASIAAYDYALVTLTSDIANAYINIRTTEAVIAVTKTNITVQADSLKIAKSRFHNGQTSLLDVQQAQTELAETQSRLPGYEAELQKQKDALGVLLGTVPTDITAHLSQVKSKGIPNAPPGVAVGIPKEAIARRPDIYQSRMEAIAKLEAIGAIKANLFPALSLQGSFDFTSTTISQSNLSDMFNWSNRSITAGPNLAWPILNYGQITNSVREQDAVYQQALLSYVNNVLKAQQEVQDNLSAYVEGRRTVARLTKANASALETTRLALVRYKEGETDYTTVLNAESQQLRIETSLAQAKGNVSLALVAIYRSVGGGWQIRGCNDVVPGQIKAEMSARTNWGNLLKQQNHQYPTTKDQDIKQRYIPNW